MTMARAVYDCNPILQSRACCWSSTQDLTQNCVNDMHPPIYFSYSMFAVWVFQLNWGASSSHPHVAWRLPAMIHNWADGCEPMSETWDHDQHWTAQSAVATWIMLIRSTSCQGEYEFSTYMSVTMCLLSDSELSFIDLLLRNWNLSCACFHAMQTSMNHTCWCGLYAACKPAYRGWYILISKWHCSQHFFHSFSLHDRQCMQKRIIIR